MGVTSIQWTDRSINPIRARDPKTGAVGHYCEMFSPGCAKCYASALQKRFRMPKFPGKPETPSTNALGRDGTVRIRGLDVFLDESKLEKVLKRRKPSKWFWCDMTDMFGSWVPGEWIDECFDTMKLAERHTHQVLTKRQDRMAELKQRHGFEPLPNVWLGCSVENQKYADRRRESMRKLSEAGWLTWVSYEPALGPVDWKGWEFLDWIVIGGESGHGAREFNVMWAYATIEWARQHDVAAFVKQLGANAIEELNITAAEFLFPNGVPSNMVVEGGVHRRRELALSDSKGGDMVEWEEGLRVREFPECTATAEV